MEPDKLNNGENPPDSSSTLQENDGCSFTNRGNDGSHNAGIFHYGRSATVDPLPFPYTPSPIAPLPLGHVHGTYSPSRHSVHDTHGDLMTDLNQLYNLQNPLVDPNSINTGTGIGNPYTQDLCFPQWNANQVSYTHDNSDDADTSMIDSPFSNHFKISEINRNYPLVRGSRGGGHGMIRQGGDADGSYLRGPPIKNFVGLGGSEMYNPQSSGVLNIDNLDHAAQFGCPKKPDGSFLSLGTRDQTDAKFKPDLSRREIPDELEGAIFPQLNASHVRQASGNFLNPSQNLWSAYPSFQNNVDGFTSWGNNEGGWTSTTNIGGAIRGTNTGLINRPFPLLQKPQTGIQSSFRKSSDRNLGFVDNSDSTYVNLDPHKPFVGGVPTSSGPFSSSSARLLHSGQIGASGFAYESANFTRASTQPTSDQLQKQFMKTVQNFSPASSMAPSFGGVKESSMRQEHSGQLFSTTDGNATVSVGNGLFPKRLGIQMNGNGATQAAGDGLFPKDECGFYPNKIGVQRPSFQEGMPLQFTKDFLGPTSTAGPVIPTAKDYGSAQASIALGGPYRRGIIRPPPAFPQVQRKKIALQPPSHPTLSTPVQRKKIALPPSKLPSSTSPPQTAPAAARPIPDRVPQIKWKDSEGLPQPTGHKCLLCKRDLSFTAEGQVYQPAIPPPVAVLPCGHTFHDHCLQLITPEDQSKDPPCIPCAIGDT